MALLKTRPKIVNKIFLKHALKFSVGGMAALTIPFYTRRTTNTICILNYHRVTPIEFIDPEFDDWNISPQKLEKQIGIIENFANIVSLHKLPDILSHNMLTNKPYVCLTFDDGYQNFYSEVLPILKKFNACATIFVATDFVGSSLPMSFDNWGKKNMNRISKDAWKAISWEELGECLSSCLVTVGSHSHQHLDGSNCSFEALTSEAIKSRQILIEKFGNNHAEMYAYPFGSTRLGFVPSDYVRAVKSAGFKLAVTTDLNTIAPDCDLNLFRLPRIEAHHRDSTSIIRAKVMGAIGPLRITDLLRSGKTN